jgi:argininosuccinate lyase
VTALLQLMMTLGKFANDMVWFTSAEFSFFNIDKSLTTGSSIMPQKQNLDIMEVLRANVSVMLSYQMQIQTVGLNLLSGYNKDLKVTKKPLMEAFALALDSLGIVDLLIHHTTPNAKNLEAALDPEIFATDEVNRLVQKGTPFREAYKKVGENLGQLKKSDPVKNIRSKKHLGATGNLDLGSYEETIEMLKKGFLHKASTSRIGKK